MESKRVLRIEIWLLLCELDSIGYLKLKKSREELLLYISSKGVLVSKVLRYDMMTLFRDLENIGYLELIKEISIIRLMLITKLESRKRRGRPKKERMLESVNVEDKIGSLLASLKIEESLDEEEKLCVMRVILNEEVYLKSGCGRVFDSISHEEIYDKCLIGLVLGV